MAHMRAALALARRGLGTVWPNPAVGCVLVREDLGGRVVGRGWTQPGGRPHAETEALRRAGPLAEGATAYVTLEPCNHQGETPPCSEALIGAGVARVVVAVDDPDPRVSGAGIARLREAGIPVIEEVSAPEAVDINAGFFKRVLSGRPLVTLKTATTLDGRIATHGGESQWISGAPARAASHRLRAEHDAIMIGSGTALADNPSLTCRLPGLEDRSPVRIVCDSRLRLPLTSQLVQSARQWPLWLITAAEGDGTRRRAYGECGVEVIEMALDASGSLDLPKALRELGARGLTRVLVEGGGHLAAALLRVGMVDRLAWFRAPCIMGGDGMPVAAAFGVEHLTDAPRFTRRALTGLGPDTFETYHLEE